MSKYNPKINCQVSSYRDIFERILKEYAEEILKEIPIRTAWGVSQGIAERFPIDHASEICKEIVGETIKGIY